MPMSLSRREGDGAILDGGAPVTLLGGHYALFYPEGGVRAWVDPVSGEPVKETFPTDQPGNPQGCPNTHSHPTVSELPWGSDLTVPLQELAGHGCNLFRVFLTDGIVVDAEGRQVTIYPFRKNAAGKWRVKEAALEGNPSDAWNPDYFRRLADFALSAEQRGVALLASLFNRHDFRNDSGVFSYFPKHYLNPERIDDPAYGLTGSDQWERFERFADLTVASANVLKVQKAFVERVLLALCPRPNVILELMNEPAGTGISPATVAGWYNHTTGLIVDWLRSNAGGWRPLIAVNATYSNPRAARYDAEAWAGLSGTLTHYEALDLVTYHGISGRRESQLAACGFPEPPSLPYIDKASIDARPDLHRATHPKKAMMYSTDGVHQLEHVFPLRGGGTVGVGRRDGQIFTSVPSGGSGEANDRIASDLDNWTFWCLTSAFKPEYRGVVHFQNHSSTLPSIMVMRDVRDAVAAGRPAAPQPVCNRGRWVARWAKVTGGAANFWFAHRAYGGRGEVVNQFGTVDNPAQAGAQGVSAIGFRYDITPVAPARFTFAPEYSLVSLSERETGPNRVAPRIVCLLCEVDGAGNPGAPLARAEQLLSGAPRQGSLALTLDLAAGRRYAVLVAAEITLSYVNRERQYGEIIARFPRMAQIDPR